MSPLRPLLLVGMLGANGCASVRLEVPSSNRMRRSHLPSVLSKPAQLEMHSDSVACTQAIRFAWANAPRVRAALALVAVSAAKRDELRAGYFPQVNGAVLGTAGFSGSGSNLGVRGMMGSPFVNRWAAGLEGSWSALEFLRIEPRVDVTYAEEAAANADRERIERDVALMIVDVYEKTLEAETMLSVAHADIASRRMHVGALDALLNAGGVIPATDLLQGRAALARSEAARAGVVADLDGLRAVLSTLVGDPRMVAARLVLDAPKSDAKGDEDVVAARAQREAARRLRDLAWRDLLPRVVVGGSAGYAHTPTPQDPGLWAAGVAVMVPLTGTFSERARQQVAAFAADSRAHEADARAQEVEVRRATLRATLRALELALPSAEASTKAAHEAMSAVEARANAGLVREVEVGTALVAVAHATSTEGQIRIRVQATRARLAWLGG